MDALKVATVVGARPQFIKAAVLSRAFEKTSVQEIIIHTGQHYTSNMSSIFFEEMNIPEPKYNLCIQERLHGAMTGKMMMGIENVLLSEKPAMVVVYGDTNSTLAAALTASKLHIPVCHIEAGLRSFNMQMPEEVNRILTDKMSSLLCCPTEQAMQNLHHEGYTANSFHSLHYTGDVMYDAAKYYYSKSDNKILREHALKQCSYILATIHRAENTNDIDRISGIIKALNRINATQEVIVPLHPRTAKLLCDLPVKPLFTIIEPVGYFDMLRLINNCRLVITDSGGLQKESFFFNKYCVVLREQTEWVELIENNHAVLAGSDEEKIVKSATSFLNKPFNARAVLYGDGKAGEKVASLIENFLMN